jgi:hypothetical protein
VADEIQPGQRAILSDQRHRIARRFRKGLSELTDRDRAKEALDRIRIRPKAREFDAEAIDRFGRMMRDNITSGPIPFRKAYIASVVGRVEVDDRAIRIVGDKATLEQVIAGKETAGPRSLALKSLASDETLVTRPNTGCSLPARSRPAIPW